MKIIITFFFTLPLFLMGQKFIEIPMNMDKTDFLYETNVNIVESKLTFKELVNFVLENASSNALSNIVVDTFNNKIVSDGVVISRDIQTQEYQYQFNYVVSFVKNINQVTITISKIYHQNKMDLLKSMGYCYDFRNKDNRFKYFDILNDMNLKMQKKVNDYKNGLEVFLKTKDNKNVDINEGFITYVNEIKKNQTKLQLSQNDYILKSAESLNLFYKQKRNSFYLSAVGFSVTFISAIIEGKRQTSSLQTNVMYLIGGGTLFTSFVLNIDSYKHIKNSSMYLKKSAEGVAIGFNF